MSTSNHEPGVVEEDLPFAKSTIGRESTVTGEKQVKVLRAIWETGADNLTFNLTELIEYAK